MAEENKKISAEEFDSRLALMQQEFVDSLPQRMADIEQAWQDALQGKADALELLHGFVHKLAGTSGTFMFKELSSQCRTLEIYLQNLDDDIAELNEEHSEQISSLLITINQSVKEPKKALYFDTPVLLDNETDKVYRIMVIDDDATLNYFLCSQLEYFGYEVLGVTNLSELYNKIQEFKPNLIVADISFPEGPLAGIKYLELFDFKAKLGMDIPKIYMSSREDIDARMEAVRSGGNAYLIKPVNLSSLLEKVREFTNADAIDRYKVLVVDDDESLVELMSYVLQQVGLDVKKLTTPENALEEILHFKPDLIMLDVNMPWCNGVELAQVIRQKSGLESIPIIFLSSETDLDIQYSAVLSGGDDFLTKPIDINRLATLIKAKAKRGRHLNSLMIRDGLTGLYNHAYIKELIDTEYYRADREHRTFSIAMIDIDNFKQLNDNYGHMLGDQVLRSFAHFLLQRLRKVDKVGRYGGEEFLIFLPDTKLDDAQTLMDDILKDFMKVSHYSNESEKINVSFSAGLMSNNFVNSAADLIVGADQLMYEAKKSGKQRVLSPLN